MLNHAQSINQSISFYQYKFSTCDFAMICCLYFW